jgi:hypothetical protein
VSAHTSEAVLPGSLVSARPIRLRPAQGGREIVELTADVAGLRTSTGSVLRFLRRPRAWPPLALLWELLTPAQATGPPVGPSVHRSEERMAATFLAGPRRHPDQDHPWEEDHGWIDSARVAQ